MSRSKTCSRCGLAFQCGSDETSNSCWCNLYPPFFTPDPVINCMCPACMHKAVKEKIDDYVSSLSIEDAVHNNKAKELTPSKQLLEGIDYYIENANYVFTAWHHLRRGYCCKNSCRHCPYGYKKQTV